jgi:DNA-binding Lrp family transcriptional regulator
MSESNIIFLKFADNKIPEFKEVSSKEWILFGEDNKFPDHLLYLFNKSSNHNAILNGKATYVYGKGFQQDIIVNPRGETINKLFKKFIADIELFGGGRFEIIWKMGGGVDVYHLPFQKLRRSKEDNGFWYSKDWTKYTRDGYRPKFIPDYDQDVKVGSQVLAYNEYRPGCDVYPLPGYFGALNDIETDVEISKYNLSVIKNGQFSSKMIIFKNGVPTDEIKRQIERDWKNKFQGSTNAGNPMLVYQKTGEAAPEVIDMSATDLDKLFDLLNKTTQAEIFSGHQVTSPMLFGIMEPGKLGGRNELQDAYEIFKNTYVNEKQQNVEEVADIIFPLLGIKESQKLEPVEPISTLINPVDFKEIIPKEWVLDKLGIDLTKYPGAVNPSGVTNTPGVVNENLKNLTGRQHQQLLRVIRQYGKGKMTREQATTMLRSSLGMCDEDIFTLLGEQSFEADYSEDQVAMMFEEIGEAKNKFHIVKSAKFDKEFFADLSQVDSDILNMIKKDKRISAKDIAAAIGSNPGYVNKRINELKEEGVLKQKEIKIGIDKIIETAVNPEKIDFKPKSEVVDVYVKYSYEVRPGVGPEVIPTTRPFCKKLIDLDRLYTRAEIESISARLGYSVFDRAGGWWGQDYQCRHEWKRNLVIKKR